MIFDHAGEVPMACTLSLLSCMRPTMSKFRYAASWSSGTGGLAANAADPISPISSPDQKSSSTLRPRGCPASASPTPSTAAVPEVIVMRTERHPRFLDASRRRRGGQVGDDVVALLLLTLDARTDGHGH